MNTISKAISVLLVISLLCGAFAVITDTDSNADDDPEADGILVIRMGSSGPEIKHIHYVNSILVEEPYPAEGTIGNVKMESSGTNITLFITGETKMYALAFDNNDWSVSVILENSAKVIIGEAPGDGDYSKFFSGLTIGAPVSVDGGYEESAITSLNFSALDGPENVMLDILNFAQPKDETTPHPGSCQLSFEGLNELSISNNPTDGTPPDAIQYWYLDTISFENIQSLYIDITGQTQSEGGYNYEYGLRAKESVSFENVNEIVFNLARSSSTPTYEPKVFGIYVDSVKDKATKPHGISFNKCEFVNLSISAPTSYVYGMFVDTKESYNGEYFIDINAVNTFSLLIDGSYYVYGIIIGEVNYYDVTQRSNKGTISILDSNLTLAKFNSARYSGFGPCIDAMFPSGSYLEPTHPGRGAIVTDENISGSINCYDNNGNDMEFVSGKTRGFDSDGPVIISENPSPGPTPPTPTEEVTKNLTTLAVMISILVAVIVLSLLAVMMARRK